MEDICQIRCTGCEYFSPWKCKCALYQCFQFLIKFCPNCRITQQFNWKSFVFCLFWSCYMLFYPLGNLRLSAKFPWCTSGPNDLPSSPFYWTNRQTDTFHHHFCQLFLLKPQSQWHRHEMRCVVWNAVWLGISGQTWYPNNDIPIYMCDLGCVNEGISEQMRRRSDRSHLHEH